LCLDKGYDYPEIEIEATKEDTCHIFVTEVWRKNDKDRICNEEMGCRKNKLLTQDSESY